MHIHLVYEEEYVEQVKDILESAGYTVTGWDYSLSQFADFSERKQINADIALVDGQAGVISKKEIIDCLGKIRKNLTNLRLIVILPETLEKDEMFIAKLLTFSIYDMYFKEKYDIDDLELWISTPKNFSNYNIETEDIRGTLIEAEKPKLQGLEATKPIPTAEVNQAKNMSFSLPKLSQLGIPNVDVNVKLPNLSSVKSMIPAFHLPKTKKDDVNADLCWDEGNNPEIPIDKKTKELLGSVIWFWGNTSGWEITKAANQYAQNLSNLVPVLLLDGNLENPGLRELYKCSGQGWECSWLAKTPGIPPRKYYSKGNLTVWLLQEPVEAEDVSDMWDVALFHVRTPKLVVVVDGGHISPPNQADYTFPVGQTEEELIENCPAEQQAADSEQSSDQTNICQPLPKPDLRNCEESIAQVLNQESAYILMVDADGLKGINDKYGHAAGTAYLSEIWNRLHNAFQDTAWYRYGGDEFYGVIGSQKATEADLLTKAETISGMGSIHGREIKIACSIGLYNASKGESAVAAMAMADHAMYQVKKIHHGGIKVFQSDYCLALIGEWAEEWLTVPVSEGWRVLVYPENTNPSEMSASNLIIAKRPIRNTLTEVWIPENNDDVSKLLEKLRNVSTSEL